MFSISLLIRFASIVYLGNWIFAGHFKPISQSNLIANCYYTFSHLSAFTSAAVLPPYPPIEHSHACVFKWIFIMSIRMGNFGLLQRKFNKTINEFSFYAHVCAISSCYYSRSCCHWRFSLEFPCMYVCVRRWQNFACFPCFDPHFMLTCCAYLNESKGQSERGIEWVHEQHV